jgi:hypothetical protein
MVVRPDHLTSQTEPPAQFDSRRLLRKETIGSTFDHETVHSLSNDFSAYTLAIFEERDPQWPPTLSRLLLKRVSCRQTGNAAADHDNVIDLALLGHCRHP